MIHIHKWSALDAEYGERSDWKQRDNIYGGQRGSTQSEPGHGKAAI